LVKTNWPPCVREFGGRVWVPQPFLQLARQEAVPMVKGVASGSKLERFAPTPWTTESEEWLALDRHLAQDHLARLVAEAIELLDLAPLFDSYLGVGKQALRPDLLLKMVIYEIQSNRPSPAQWARDVHESEPVRWLLFGMEPSRARLYDFRDRIAPFLSEWSAQLLCVAVMEKMTPATRASLDSSSIAAHASRRQLLNEERLQKRRESIDAALECRRRGETLANLPGWLAKSEDGLREQKQRYQRAAVVLCERQAANAQRRACKRKSADKILVSPADPEAILTRDKLNVFRPLYSVQLLRDLDSPLVLGYDVLTQNNDNGVVEPMVEQMTDHIGHKPTELLVDSGYVSMHHLEFCDQAGITFTVRIRRTIIARRTAKSRSAIKRRSCPKAPFAGCPRSTSINVPKDTGCISAPSKHSSAPTTRSRCVFTPAHRNTAWLVRVRRHARRRRTKVAL